MPLYITLHYTLHFTLFQECEPGERDLPMFTTEMLSISTDTNQKSFGNFLVKHSVSACLP